MGFKVRSIVLMTEFSSKDSVMGWNRPVDGPVDGTELTVAMSRNESFRLGSTVHLVKCTFSNNKSISPPKYIQFPTQKKQTITV